MDKVLDKTKEQLEAEIIALQARVRELEQAQQIIRQQNQINQLSDQRLLQERTQEFVALADNAPDIILRFSPDMRYTYVNRAMSAVLGIPPEAILNKTNCELGMPQELVDEWEAIFKHVCAMREEYRLETKFPTVMGWRTFDARVVPEFGQDGAVTSLLVISRDITEQKATVNALRQSREQFAAFMNHLPGVAFIKEANGRYLYTNISIGEAFDHSINEWINKTDEELFEPQRAAEIRVGDGIIINEQRALQSFEIVARQDGLQHWLLTKFPISAPTDKLQFIGGIGIDITAIKQAEEEISGALAREKELSELKSRFISAVSHEYRTPLSVILSSAELLQHYGDKLADDRKAVYYQQIISSVNTMVQLLDDILIIGKAEAGRIEFNPVLLNVSEFCRQLVTEVKFNQNDKPKINLILPSEPLVAMLDEKLLRQILFNLLGNAVKYTPVDGLVDFEVVKLEDSVRFRFSDNGIGIPQTDIGNLFHAFNRASNVGNVPGTGLGLAIVKKAVEIFRGEITVTSREGEGSTFVVTLPVS